MRALVLLALAACHETPTLVPEIDGDFWRIASNPDLGAYTTAGQQPVDFSIWQAADGSWQLQGCIRFTNVGGNTRLFYRWQGASLTATDWTPIGIAMIADPSLGETAGGLQAPYVFRDGGTYHMFYGAWDNICSATSSDGITFTRVLDDSGQCPLFAEPRGGNPRDPMVVRVDDHWQLVYTAFDGDLGKDLARTSRDLVHWSDRQVIAYGGVTGTGGTSAECPFVVHHEDTFTLLRTQSYAPQITEVYQSDDPLQFGLGTDDHHVGTLAVAAPEILEVDGDYFVATLTEGLDGYRIARLRWSEAR